MNHFLLLSCLFISVLGHSQNANDLFFSEYVEGSSNNKYLEIFNGTGATVDLTNYQVILYSNGATTPSKTHPLEGNLETGHVLVLKNSKAEIYLGSTINSSATNFNGNDAVALVNISTGNYIDIIGRIGESTYWSSEAYATTDKTLVRKATVVEGVLTNPSSGFPTLATEWDVFDQNTIDNLGSHLFSPPTVGTLSNFELSDYTVETGQAVTFTWDAVDVDYIRFQMEVETGNWKDFEGLTHIDATLGTLLVNVPIDATEGTYKLRVVDVNNSSVFAESNSFTITDIHFAGLDEDNPAYPAANETGVPTDLCHVVYSEEGNTISVRRILICFNEDIQAGTGNIIVDIVTEGINAFTLDVASDSKVEFCGSVLAINIVDDLSGEKVYRVTVPCGAINDKATIPNAFTGFEWSFTTGSRNSLRTISEIQTPLDLTALDASTYVGQYITTSGVVTYKRSGGFYLQDGTTPYSGIYVYDSNTSKAVNVGDVVTLAGQVQEDNNLTEISNVLSYEVFTPMAFPEPVTISMPFDKTNAEPWESMLVMVQNVTYASMGSGAEFNVVDGGSNVGIIDDYLYTYTPVTNETFNSIAGIMNDCKNAYKLAPRSADDVASVTNSVGNAERINLTIYPNPVMDELRILSEEDLVVVEVVNMAGQVVACINKHSSYAGEIVISMARKDKGVYVVKVITENGTIIKRKIIKE